MATLTDRPPDRPPPAQPGARRWTPGRRVAVPPRPPGRPPRRRRARLLGGAYLLAPLSAAAAALLALAALVVALVLAFGSGPAPPATGAAALVPDDALLYLHVSTDPARPEVRRALAEAGRIPGLAALLSDVGGRLAAVLSDRSGAGFAQIRPWLGREAALAVLNTPGQSAGTLIVLDVRDRHRARAFLAANGALPAGAYRRVALLRQPSGTVLAFLGHYLVAGQASSVRAAVRLAAGGASLAASPLYQRAAAGEPADRVLDAYVSAAGLQRALLPRTGLLGALGVLLYQPPFSAATITLSPSAAGLALRVHTALFAPAVSGPPRQFTPSLPDALPAGSPLMLDAAGVRGAAGKFLAAAARLGMLGRVGTLLGRLGQALRAEGVSVGRVLASLGGETALAVVPGRGGGGPAPVLVARPPHPAAARAELASLEGPLTQAFAPPSQGAGVAPEVSVLTRRGATISELTLAPGFQLDWTVAHGLLIVSTTPAGLAAVLDHTAPLSGEPGYRATLGSAPGQVTSLVFLDLAPLLRLGQQTGLIGETPLESLLPELERVRAIGLASTGGGTDTTTQLQIRIR